MKKLLTLSLCTIVRCKLQIHRSSSYIKEVREYFSNDKRDILSNFLHWRIRKQLGLNSSNAKIEIQDIPGHDLIFDCANMILCAVSSTSYKIDNSIKQKHGKTICEILHAWLFFFPVNNIYSVFYFFRIIKFYKYIFFYFF